ncbi:Subtilisin-like protease SBT1.6 [Thalictrum thalictroides]|uniref:Subtilisin-like protease SBT1.6 n=1 Tax=Thalictrum thalictroides TaxID=46969 RepID=A0A7J6X6B1_THATH|nr:Subtilisin-like protease SBT1.6 [Thalictrum thalictroides]
MASSSSSILVFKLFLLLLFFTHFILSTATVDDLTIKTYIFRVDEDSKPSIFPSHYHWYTSSFADPIQILHVYDTVFHGFSATLTSIQATSILQHPSVLAAFEDRRRQLHTTRSPQFLGLRNQRGLWSESDYGSDVIVGVLDTGIWPERRSFSDLNLGPIPSKWKGVCETGFQFSSAHCNRKIVGARFFAKGHEAAGRSTGGMGGINQTVEFRSPRDADGHGTHTASTAAGDGVSSPYYLDPIAIGSYGAASRGVFVASSAGNDGPTGMSVTNLAPWLTTVGAGTIDRNFPSYVILGNGKKLSGVSLYSGLPLNGKMFPVVYPGKSGLLSASLCMENSLDPKLINGKIVICDRGSNPRVAKGLVVKKAGGVGMILANGASHGEGLVGDAHLIPACALGANEADSVKSYISSTLNPTATIVFRGTVVGIKPAPIIASFSARGPNGLTPEILKPDLMAPGVNILAAWTDAIGPTGLDSDNRKSEFNILSGTSMACPHISGAAALLKSAHPDWSPAAIRSAMMTSASNNNNLFESMTDESTGKPATPFDIGSGHVNLDLAMDPGLVYDIGSNDYVNFLCSINYDPKMIQVITRMPARCPARKALPENLNYPSISAVFPISSPRMQTKTFIRTVTNVGPLNSVYTSKIEVPKGASVTVIPSKLVFSSTVKKLSFAVTITASSKSLVMGDSGGAFGYLSWLDGRHVVRSPIAITLVDPL